MLLADAIEAWGLEGTQLDQSQRELVRRIWAALRKAEAGRLDIATMSRDDAQDVMALFDDADQDGVADILNTVRTWYLERETAAAAAEAAGTLAMAPATMSLVDAIGAWTEVEATGLGPSKASVRKVLDTLRSSPFVDLNFASMTPQDSQGVMALFDESDQMETADILNSVRRWFFAWQATYAKADAASDAEPPDASAPSTYPRSDRERAKTAVAVVTPSDIPLQPPVAPTASTRNRGSLSGLGRASRVRRQRLAGLALLLVVAVAVGAFFALRGGGDQADQAVILVSPDVTPTPTAPPVVIPTTQASATPTPRPTTTATPTPSPEPTATAVPVAAAPAAPVAPPVATATPQPTPTVPTPTPTAAALAPCSPGENPGAGVRYRVDGLSSTGSSGQSVAVRAEPSGNASVTRTLAPGTSGLTFSGCSRSDSSGFVWWQLSDGGWLVSFFVSPQ